MVINPWQEVEITLTAAHDYPNPYTAVEVWAEFSHDGGETLRRPAFWDGESTWKIRFASPLAEGRWTWRSFSSTEDVGLAGQSGEMVAPFSLKREILRSFLAQNDMIGVGDDLS